VTGREAPAAPTSTRRIVRAIIQLSGFAIGLALLGWCIREALKNQTQLKSLYEAPRGLVASLLALTALSVILNGLVFWVLLRPVRQLRPADVVAVNALATFLNYLPFKLSVISRILIHNRRDGLPIFVVGAWLVAMGAVLVAGLGPLMLATAITGHLTAGWFAIAGSSLIVVVTTMILIARAFSGTPGMDRLFTIVDALHVGPFSSLIRAGFVRDLHAGLTMLAAPGPVIATIALRLGDTLVQAARFAVAAEIVGKQISLDEALLFSIAYFAIGVLSPVGMLGFRESGTAGAASLVGIADPAGFVVIPLVVGAAEAVVNLGGAGLAIAWLRPARFLFPAAPAPPAAAPTEPG
jgi:hypothetical protein